MPQIDDSLNINRNNSDMRWHGTHNINDLARRRY
jgi:hypothetical protein